MKKTNNKGFSLVELIIVVAIMAILIGVLAPQYIKYVERSRVAADENIADSLTAAVQSALADEDYESDINENAKATITGGASGGIKLTGDTSTKLDAALDEYFATWQDKKFKSKKYKEATYTVTVTLSTSGTGFKAVTEWKNVKGAAATPTPTP